MNSPAFRSHFTAPAEFDQALSKARIGEIMVRQGSLAPQDLVRVLKEQNSLGASAHRERFGEIAIRLGLADRQAVEAALSEQLDYPLADGWSSTLDPTLIMAHQPDSVAAEAIRTLRSQLTLRWLNTRPMMPAITVAAADRGAGASFMAANLAIAFAQMGRRTLLIDANFRHPDQARLFSLSPDLGLAGVLSGRAGLEQITAIREIPMLSVLGAGHEVPNPQELIARATLPEFLQRLASGYELMILDSPAAGECADAQLLAAHARAALIVARRGVSGIHATAALQEMLSLHGVFVTGVAFNES